MGARKVFVVGWHRTGTTSLHVALQQLGYRVWDFDADMLRALKEDRTKRVIRAARRADAFRDFPWNLLWREFDDRYPDARFILTLRDTNSWFASYRRLHQQATEQTVRWLYGPGSPEREPQRYIDRYERHNRDVLDHFAGRSDFLTFNAFEGDGWAKLCRFLGHQPPSVPYPDEGSATFAGESRSILGHLRRRLPL